MRRQVATKVSQEIYRPRVEKMMMDISIKTTETYKNNLPKDYLTITENHKSYFSFQDRISIDGVYCGSAIGHFEEALYENGNWIKYGNNPLQTFLFNVYEDKYTNKRICRSKSRTGIHTSQTIKLVEKVPSPNNHYDLKKQMNWSEVTKLIKELTVVLDEAEKIFCEIYEFLLQFTTYVKAEAEWPDIERYLTKVTPTTDKKGICALVKSGKQLKSSISKARTNTIGA